MMLLLPILLMISEFISMACAVWSYVNDETLKAIYWVLWVIAINASWRQR